MRARIEGVRKMLAASPNESIDFSFLDASTIEK
jgi:hypothetical protein